jgi:hypothetical protein
LPALVIRFECRFTTAGIAHQHDDTVTDFTGAEPFAGEANTLGDVGKQAQTGQGVGQKSHFQLLRPLAEISLRIPWALPVQRLPQPAIAFPTPGVGY